MGEVIAAALGVAAATVNVKASTGNLGGSEGAGRSISASAIAWLVPVDDAATASGASADIGLQRIGLQRIGLQRIGSGRKRQGMTIQLHDTMNRVTREFLPLEPGHARIYSCGPTVYGPAHVGNFRSFLFADLLVRYLRYKGLRVTWVMNLTDVDDKIIKAARAEGVSIGEISDRYAALFMSDVATMRMTVPDVMPRATEHITNMVELIGKLLENGHAYKTDDGSIFFRIASWPAYGRLARLDPEGMRVGERVEADEYGKDDVATSPSGRAPSQANRVGRQRSDPAGPAGTSSARR